MTLAAGTTFGPYQIIEPLGRGGMATVYKAYEPGLDRHVALKVLPSEFLHDEGFAERFRREAKVIARLEHPNIIPIHNFGIEDITRTPWMAMRLIAGGPLSGLMKKARMPADRVVPILRGVAEALDYAHGKGVIHRDIKPQNILLDEAERVYLADFGIAKMVEGSPGLTATGMISGTPQYMAPEQAMANTVDGRADIYALGIVAYEMLTGRVPFAADTPVAVLMKHVQDPIPIPSPRDVPEPLTRALLKALAKRPEDRWPTSVAFVNALGEALGQISTLSEVPGAPPTAFVPTAANTPATGTRPRTPQAGTPHAGTPRAGTTRPAGPPPGAPQATPYPGTTPYRGTARPGTPASGTAYPSAVGGAYPGTPPAGTAGAGGSLPPPPPPPAPPYQSGLYPTASPGAPPTYAAGGHPAGGQAVPAGGGVGRGLVAVLVIGVVGLGLVGVAALVLFLRPSAPASAPERPPVTLRSPATADGFAPSPLPPPTTMAYVPETVPPATMAVASPSPVISRPSAAPTPRRAATPVAAPVEVADTDPAPPPPVTLPPVAEPARPIGPGFPGAGKVDLGAKFYEKTLAYQVGMPLAFDGHVGPLKVPVVQFAINDTRRRFGRVDPQRAEMRAVFPTVDCPQGAGEWDYKVIVELMDESGRRLERLDDGGSCENEIKTVAATKPVLKTLLPLVRGVRVRLEAAKD